MALSLAVSGCENRPSASPLSLDLGAVDAELNALRERVDGVTDPAASTTFLRMLETTVADEGGTCSPSPRALFFGAGDDGLRLVRGTLPHYGLFLGPMSYSVARSGGASPRFVVRAVIGVDAPPEERWLELPDCVLRPLLEGKTTCEGVAFAASGTTDACPASGTFGAYATRANVDALLKRWSDEAEGYWNRDAERYGLPVRYDFSFVRAERSDLGALDLRVPLAPTCGRTPYFAAMRSGWSLPIVAHEVGHTLGLLDEYEALSGIASFYPKTPFVGAETSRMGFSMKEETRVLPLHHYLVVRRYLCADASEPAPFSGILR